MRYIEDLRNEFKKPEYAQHKGEVWVIGCGSSLDDYPDDFFDDKISIAVNWSFLRFPKANYFLFCHDIMPSLIRQVRPDLMKKCILTLTDKQYNGITWHGDYVKNDPLWAEWDSWCRVETKEAFQEMADKIIKGEKTPLKSLKTTVHNAVDAAVILGAKKVTLVGCEGVAGKFKWHAQRGGMWFFYKEPFESALLTGLKLPGGGEYPPEWRAKGMPVPYKMFVRQGTLFLAEVFKPYGIDIKKFYYKDFGTSKKGYEEIID